MYMLAAQKLIFDTLSGNISATVYDDVPDQPPGMPASSFPYVVIGFDDAEPFDTDSFVGSQIGIELNIWTVYEGKKEAKQIMEQIYNLLHRQTLTSASASVVDCLHTFSTIPDVGASNYVHGVSRYRLTLTEDT